MPQVNFAEKLKNQDEEEESKVDFASKIPPRGVPTARSTDNTRQSIVETLGADIDTENFAPASLRISLSRGDNLAEKNLRIKRDFPEGEVKVIPKSVALGTKEDTLVFRESPQAQFKFLEPPGRDLVDVIEGLAPSAEAIAGEALLALVSRGASIPSLIARQAAGATAGEGVEQGVQSLTRVQDQDALGIAQEATKEGGFSLLGGVAGSPLNAAANTARGSGVLRVGESGVDALQAAGRVQDQTDIAIRDLITPGLIADNPLIGLQEKQAAVVLPAMNRRYNQIANNLNKAVQSLQPQNIARASANVLSSIKKLGDTTISKLGVTAKSAKEGGIALQRGIAEYDIVAKRLVDDLYNAARKIDEPQFNRQGLETILRDLELGAKGAVDPRVKKLIQQVREIKGPIQLSDRTLTVAEQLRNARTEAFALKTVKPGEVADQATGQANDIFRAINDTLDNPVNASEEFVTAWRSASEAAKERFDTLGKSVVVRASREESPEKLVQRLVKPFNASNLQALRQTIEPARWKQFQDAAYGQLLKNPERLSKALDAFDQETLDVLMPRSHQASWRRAAQEMDRISAVGVERRNLLQVTNQDTIRNLLETAKPNTTLVLRKAIANTRDKGLRDSVRAGIIDFAWDGVIKTSGDRVKINREVFLTRIERLKKSGLLNVLSAPQRSALQDIDTVARAIVGGQADAGTSIRGMEIAAGVPKLKPSALIGLLQSGIVSHFYLSPAGRRILIGKGVESSQGEFVRIFAAALARVAAPEDISQFREEEQ